MEALNYRCENEEQNSKIVSDINIDMKEMILTPHTCTCLIIEILKALLYEKSQIPYPYSWLKSSLSKQNMDPTIHSHNIAIIVQKYFNLANNAFKCVEDITANVNAMMSNPMNHVQEVIVLFGTTPYSPKEVFTIRFPEIARGHIEKHHRSGLQKKLHTVLRNVFLSDEWLNAMQHQLQVTNTFIMAKKVGVLRHEDDYFEHYNNFIVPSSVRNTIITLNYDKKYDKCCDHLKVFIDPKDDILLPKSLQSIQSRNVEWFQAKGVVKGFQDFFIEKVSVSELW